MDTVTNSNATDNTGCPKLTCPTKHQEAMTMSIEELELMTIDWREQRYDAIVASLPLIDVEVIA